MIRRHSLAVVVLFLLLSSTVAAAPSIEADQQAYCAYLDEQARAQSNLLRSPDAVAAFTQPETGLPKEVTAGVSLHLSNMRKAGITLDAARQACDLYKASTNVRLYLEYALPGMEKDALTYRLGLIEAASTPLEELIEKTSKMVDAQNMTRPMLVNLMSTRIKLDVDRADTRSKLAALYVPSLPDEPLRLQVAAKQASDVGEQKSLARLARQNNWDVALSLGAHRQVDSPAEGLKPYGEIRVTYNLGSHATDGHLDRSVEAYANWKKVDESDSIRLMEVLHNQLQETILAQQGRLKSLEQESREIEENLKLVGESETSAGQDFRNQLTATRLLLGIETGDASHRIERLREFVEKNF
jgi:hypothetical protein